MKTKAVRIHGKMDLRLEEIELPQVGPDDVQVKVISDSICMSTYKAAVEGEDHKRVPNDVAEHPTIVGHEFCGVITEVGENWKNKYKPGQGFAIQPAHFYKGASVTPVYDPIELQINKLRQKVENGAEYIQTQGIFDLETFKRFLDKVDAAGIKTHIMAGIIPLKAAGMARYMNENVPGIAVPQDMIDKLAAAAAEGKEKGVKGLPMQLGIEMAAEMIAKIKDEHLCDGVHIMAIGAEKNVPAILEKAGVTI